MEHYTPDNNQSPMLMLINSALTAVALSTWWIVSNIDVINKFLEAGLKIVSLISFLMLIIINRKAFIKGVYEILGIK